MARSGSTERDRDSFLRYGTGRNRSAGVGMLAGWTRILPTLAEQASRQE